MSNQRVKKSTRLCGRSLGRESVFLNTYCVTGYVFCLHFLEAEEVKMEFTYQIFGGLG
jgi:hypothetical protein